MNDILRWAMKDVTETNQALAHCRAAREHWAELEQEMLGIGAMPEAEGFRRWQEYETRREQDLLGVLGSAQARLIAAGG